MPLSQVNRLVPHSTKENTHNKIQIILLVATQFTARLYCFFFRDVTVLWEIGDRILRRLTTLLLSNYSTHSSFGE